MGEWSPTGGELNNKRNKRWRKGKHVAGCYWIRFDMGVPQSGKVKRRDSIGEE